MIEINPSHVLSAQSQTFLDRKTHAVLIDGQWVHPDSDASLIITNPATEQQIGQVSICNRQTVDEAVQAAKKAYAEKWRKLAPVKKQKLLLDLATALENEADTMAEILTLENGKLHAHAKSEIRGAAATFRYYAGWATKLEGQTLDLSLRQAPGRQNFAFTRREPVGVVAAIVPWNFPISIAAWKLAPLLAAGCTTVLKPSEVTPLSTLYFAQLFDAVGFPPGVVNVITGDGVTGAALTTHPDVDKITFTGSSQVGKIIGKSAMDQLKDVSLELGGKSPGIVFEDANLEAAATGIAMGIFRNGGQVCVAGSRVYVHAKVYDKLVADIAALGQKMTLSDGFDENADLGPLVSAAHLDSVRGYVDKGVADGVQLVCGGHRPDRKGYYMEPTVFSTTDNSQRLVAEEIFGPVLVAIPFKDEEEALRLANESRYGLSSTVWTKDISKALRCVDALDAGWVFVNAPARSDANFPIGGNKQSGIGRELGKTGVYAYTKLKSVNIVY